MSQLSPAELIERKRDGGQLDAEELQTFLAAFLRGEIPDYQMAAFLMAVFYQGLDPAELSTFTAAIVASGRTLTYPPGLPLVDKHSTGGVGDKVSLVLAPALAAAGVRVPMMSGRGLGHTGGTLDKLEAIPGFRTRLDPEEFQAVLERVGCAMIGQTDEIAPLDGRLYALRDVTGTVPSIPLIASSIVSKKVAEGIQALVLDVKCGGGAFLPDLARGRELARTMITLAAAHGVKATALITAMDQPLGRAIGNALEVRESLTCLTGGGPEDLRRLVVALGAELLAATGVAADQPSGRSEIERVLDDGSALERFQRLVDAQGGEAAVVSRPDALPAAPLVVALRSKRAGHVTGVDTRELGLVAVQLGAGRRRMEDQVRPDVGLEWLVRVGDRIEEGQELARVHAASEADVDRARQRLYRAVRLTEDPPDEGAALPLIVERVGRPA